MSDLGETFKAYKQERREKKTLNAINSEDILIQRNIPFKKFTEDHYRVGDYNFWPSTGLFIHVKENKRGRGVFNLLKLVEKNEVTTRALP